MRPTDQAVKDIERMFGVVSYCLDGLPHRRRYFVHRWVLSHILRTLYRALDVAVKEV